MHRIGLAFSGGGFRGALFHLGMVRFLREANLLPSVTHITSVSGGSIFAAHLVLNWDRYTGSLKEFDAAAAELIRFVQMDVRNRVIRRFPLAVPLRVMRMLGMRRPDRQMTLTGLLEYHYEKYLYGDTCLFQLPEKPRLYILATNLSEGCLCAFSRDGLLMQRRRPGQGFRFERIHTGLATVPMAVTASSAFPGFFPPLELQGQDVGADPGKFGRLVFTDGGVYDNLGVRMFRCLERSWMAREVRPQRDDLRDGDEALRALDAAAKHPDDSPLRRLAQMLDLSAGGTKPTVQSRDASIDHLLDRLWHVMNHEHLGMHPNLARLTELEPDALALIEAARSNNGEIEAGEQLWLNRQLVDAAFRQATGKPCFASPNVLFDTVLVSDAGKQFKISSSAQSKGLISTAMRSTEVAMDRVWQLEVDTFTGTPGFVFAPISRVVEPEEDPTALHPEVQRMSIDVRTDMDRFTPLEVSALVQHGYGVGRSACRSRPDLFGSALPIEAPWDPLKAAHQNGAARKSSAVVPSLAGINDLSLADKSNGGKSQDSAAKPVPAATVETVESRTLQKSAARQLYGNLLDYRDWTSFVYVPLLVPLLFVMPYFAIKWYHQSQVAQHLVEGLAMSNQDYSVMSKLMQDGPSPLFTGMESEEATTLPVPDYSGFEVIADTRVLDLRPWKVGAAAAAEGNSWGYFYRRMRVQKLEPTANKFVIQVITPAAKIDIRTLNNRVPSQVQWTRDTTALNGKSRHTYQVAFDLTKYPVNEVIDLPMELVIHEPLQENLQSVNFYVNTDTGLISCWLLLPDGKEYESFELLRYPDETATAPDKVIPANLVNVSDGQILAFTLLSVKPGFVYECRWRHRE